MEKKNYNTKNREMILDYLKSNSDIPVTIKEILNFLNENGVDVNRSTVYRYLSTLCEKDILIKYVDNDEGKTVYQYIEGHHECNTHIHMKCSVCNKIYHLDNSFMKELRIHLENDYHFDLQCEGSILYGICERCR